MTIDDFVAAQTRINVEVFRCLDEAGVMSRRQASANLLDSSEKLSGQAKHYLRGFALGLADGRPPHLTVIDGDKDD